MLLKVVIFLQDEHVYDHECMVKIVFILRIVTGCPSLLFESVCCDICLNILKAHVAFIISLLSLTLSR